MPTQSNTAETEFPPDLLVELDRSRPRTLRAQLERGLREAIAGGSLPPGTALPPSRARAARGRATRAQRHRGAERAARSRAVPAR